MRRLAPFFLLSITAIWGWTFVLVKEGTQFVGPFTFLAARFLLATAVLVLLFWRVLRQVKRPTLGRGAAIGLALFGGYFFQTWGLAYTSATKSGLLTGLSVVFVPFLASLAARERVRLAHWAGAALGASGLATFVLARSGVSPFNPGDLLTLFGAVAFAAHLILVDRFVRKDDYRVLLVIQVAVVAVLSVAGTLAFETMPHSWPAKLVEGVVITGLLATALSFYLMNRFQEHSTAAYTAILFTMEPVFAGLFGFLLLGETLTWLQGAGGLLILAGMVLVPLVKQRTRRSARG
jgi:drug/metabolite transporter (DMT)-like permease